MLLFISFFQEIGGNGELGLYYNVAIYFERLMAPTDQVCCSVLQCSMLQCVAVCCSWCLWHPLIRCVAVAVCCSAVQCVAVFGSVVLTAPTDQV